MDVDVPVAVRAGKRELWRFLSEGKEGRKGLKRNEVSEMNGNEGKLRQEVGNV